MSPVWNPDTPSRRELIIREVVDLLGQPGGPEGLLVHRYRTSPINRGKCPASIPYALRDPVKPDTHDITVERKFRIRIEHRVAVVGDDPEFEGTSLDEALDPLLTWATHKLLADRTLGGLCTDLREVDAQWDGVELDRTYGACGQDFEIDYEHDEEDLTTLDGS